MIEALEDKFQYGYIPEVQTEESLNPFSKSTYLIVKVREDHVAYFKEEFPRDTETTEGYKMYELDQVI